MQGDFREVIVPNEIVEPTGECIWIDWGTVPSGKKEIVVLPLIAQAQALLGLPSTVLSQQGDAGRRELYHPLGSPSLWGVGDHALVGNVYRVFTDAQCGGIQVNIAPLQATEFSPPQSSVE